MKKLVVLLTVACCASGAFATDYSLVDDWVLQPGSPANWSFGSKVETGYSTGVFGAFAATTDHYWSNPFDMWMVPNTQSSTFVAKASTDVWPYNSGANSVILNPWVVTAAVARLTPAAGTYNLSAIFKGAGWLDPPIGNRIVYVQKTDTTIWSSALVGYATASTAQQITLALGDYLDFIVTDAHNYSCGFTNTDATLTLVYPISYPTSSATGQYMVNWSSVSQATSYQLERSSNGGSSWSQIYSGPNTSYPETISNGSYRYRIKATYSGGSSSSWNVGARDCVVSLPVAGCVVTLATDWNLDCVVDFKDIAVLGQQWVGIDYNDIDVLNEQWLKCTKTSDPNCQLYIEPAMADKWMKQSFTGSNPTPPILFTYNNVSSATFLPTWGFSRTSTVLDPNRTQWTLVYTEPGNGPLKVTCQVIEYHDYPAVDWTIYFKNIGTNNTPILKDIQGLNAFFVRSDAGEFILNGIKGDWTAAESFQPYQITLGTNAGKNFTPSDHLGKSTSGPDGWPYFNLQMPGSGILMAVGWPGQWASTFARDAYNGLRITAGQQLTNLYLKPGEEIRTPLIAMLFWQGTDVVRAQNLWRRWYIAHNMPRINGQPQQPITHIGGDNINVANAYHYYGIYPDVLWRDAGWYPCSNGPYTGGDSWLNTGTWEPDPVMYPNGFRPVSDQLHAVGMKFLLWFEPERVGDLNSWLGINHPEWLLQPGSVGLILDEGNPAALNWLINHIDGMIKSQGIDWYREDMNGGGPCTSWRNNDAGDRQGITENFYVQGHLAYWDELRRRNPGLHIDSCASGGRRNDLETMRRAVPLTRSDYMSGVEGNQGHTYGLSSWLPFQGTGCYFYDTYSFRSFYLPSFGMAAGIGGSNIAAQQKAYAECRQIAPSMLFGDYYPLTPYSLQLDQWIAWQFHRSELEVGVVQVFRRANSTVTTMTFKLQGLDPVTTYKLTDMDGIAVIPNLRTGSDLMNNGFTLMMSTRPSARIITYTKN
jgi:alpha-galactosidase